MARFYFAWANATETTFMDSHKRTDEDVVSFEISQDEGEVASLSISVRNPRIGLLGASRKTWAWFAWGNSPLFFGRLVGIPDNIHQEIVTLVFTAKPVDFAAQKIALAASLKVLPYYDPVFLSEQAQADPDSVLEGYAKLWHVDRVTGAVTTSDILTGEDGLEDFQENEVPYDSVRVNIVDVPVRTITVEGSVGWKQAASGAFSIIGKDTVETYTGKSLIAAWPKAGASLGGGWTVASAFATDNWNIDGTDTLSFSVSWSSTAKAHASGDTLSTSISSSKAPLRTPSVVVPLTLHTISAVGEAGVDATYARVPLWNVSVGLTIGYDVSRVRKENVSFTLSAALQPVVTLPGEEEVQTIKLSGADVGVPLGGVVPIGDVARRSYFSTDRGLQSLEYLICLARARLLMASRAVEVEFACRAERAIELSCRMNARLFDRRLPGGEATGKIKGYRITGDGDSGAIMGSVTIGCAIGYGGTVAAVAGDPLYVETGYVSTGYQAYENTVVVLGPGDVGYTKPVDAPNDDGLSFPPRRSQVVISQGWHGSEIAQKAAIEDAAVVPDARFNPPAEEQPIFDAAKDIPEKINAAMKVLATYYGLRLKAMDGGPFESTYNVDMTGLVIPRGIDLEFDNDFVFAGPGDELMLSGPGSAPPMLWR